MGEEPHQTAQRPTQGEDWRADVDPPPGRADEAAVHHDSSPVRILLVEDSPSDAAMVRAHLADDNLACEVETVTRLAEAVDRIAVAPPDCVLLDLNLPDSAGLETITAVVAGTPDLPVVILTGLDDDQAALEAVYVGAQDYLTKRHLSGPLLWRTIRYAMERKRVERMAREQALRDALTGLCNRRALVDRLDHAVERLDREPGSIAVLFLDLDRFKWVNDSLGHSAGDQLLVEVAARLQIEVRSPDLVARFSGDEFLVLCERVTSVYAAAAVAKRILETLQAPFGIEGTEVWVGASIGIATTSDPHVEAEALLRQADAAMYRAKRRGGSAFEVYDEASAELVNSRLRLLAELHRAVESTEFVVHYQPIVDLADGATIGAEALVRWQRPDGRLAPPAEFIELAEETGMIVPIGEFVLTSVCSRLAAWTEEEKAAHPQGIKVNVSVRQLEDPDFVSRVREALASTGADPGHLGLEITETALMRDAQAMLERLLELKALGVQLVIDDFGTGYSSLTYLQVFPFDSLKIDMSFTQNLTAIQDQASALVGAVIDLGHALELEVIAEGVETQECVDRLRVLGCRFAQGFYFGRPAPPKASTVPA